MSSSAERSEGEGSAVRESAVTYIRVPNPSRPCLSRWVGIERSSTDLPHHAKKADLLRVGLTGGLGSGKSIAAAIFQSLGAHILSSDEIGRALMQPGQPVYDQIVANFGPSVILPDGRLNRPILAHIAFTNNRLDELNAIVHPAVIDRQTNLANEIAARDPHAIVIVESALIFETKFGGEGSEAWNHRFDKLILVTAPEELRIARFIARAASTGVVTAEMRSTLEAEAHRRIARQIPDDQKASRCNYILTNSGPLTELEWQIDRLWPLLITASNSRFSIGRDSVGKPLSGT